MTFSVVARCAMSGQFGVAISSSSPAVAARCAHARAGIGAVTTQNITNPALGPLMLDQLAAGRNSVDAVSMAIKDDKFSEYRQLLAIDIHGITAVHSGAHSLGLWNTSHGIDCVTGGNLLATSEIPQAMVLAFESATGSLGDRLLQSMRAALDLGGEIGPLRSAGLLIVHEQSWPYADLRVDWADDTRPIEALARAWEIYQPQADQYVMRALKPTDADSFGVPGNL